MSKQVIFILFMFQFFITARVSSADIDLDISGSNVEIQDSRTMRVRNVTAPGYAGKYWIDFQWDKTSLAFIPVKVGAESIGGKSWTFSVNGEGSSASSSGVYDLTLSTHPSEGTITLEYKITSGQPYIGYVGLFFIQGNNKFTPGNSAYITDWGGWKQFYVGQTATATINNIPSWFDFDSVFVIYTDFVNSHTLNSDGTVD